MAPFVAGQPAIAGWNYSPNPRWRQVLKRLRLLRLIVLFAREARAVVSSDCRRLLWRVQRSHKIRSYLASHAVRKLQIGCGPVVLSDWLNSDLRPVRREQMFLDVTRPFPLPAESIDYIFSEHLIGSLSYGDGRLMLQECYRVLKGGGRLRLSTPDLQRLASLYAPAKTPVQAAYVEWVANDHRRWADAPLEGFAINALFHDASFIYDRTTLTHLLERVGFVDIQFRQPGESTVEELRGLERHGQVIGSEDLNVFESLIVEARKGTAESVAAVKPQPAANGEAEAPPAWLKSSRIPSLDGLRAFSILLVTFSHLGAAPGTPLPHSWHRFAGAFGEPGVDVFFVISGFLITHLLLRERDRTGSISLVNFYIRRGLRIFPAYFFLLATAYMFASAGWLSIQRDAWLPMLTYTSNLLPPITGNPLGQIWSLCVEEHFYMLWPFVLLTAGVRARFVLVATVLAAPVLRALLQATHTTRVDSDFFTLTRIDTLAIGCLLAFAARSKRFREFMYPLRGHADFAAVTAIAVFAISVGLISSGTYQVVLKRAVEATAIATLLWVVVSRPDARLGRLLNAPVVAGIGVLSYSLYLAQFLAAPNPAHGWPLGWWWNAPLIVAYALISYCFIERPLLRLKERFYGAETRVRSHPGGAAMLAREL